MKKVNLTNWRKTFAWKSPPIYLMAVCFGLLLFNQATAQCPDISTCANQTVITDVDDTDALPPCISGQSEDLGGNFQDGECVEGSADAFNCIAYVFQRSSLSTTLTIGGDLGQGQGCQGDIDVVYMQYTDPTDGSLVCSDFMVSGSGLDLELMFPLDTDPITGGWAVLEMTIFVCANSNANATVCDACANDPNDPLSCGLIANCPASLALGTFDCSDIATLPAPPTDQASLEAEPYSVVFNNPAGSCGTIVVESVDSGSPNACESGSFTRTITAFDDIGDADGIAPPDGILNGDEALTALTCVYTYTIIGDDALPVFDAAPAAIADIACGDALPMQEVLTATDDCTAPLVVVASVDPFAEDICAGYAVTYRWTVTDDCDNEAIETITFNVLPDTEAPTFIESPLPADLMLTCDQAIPMSETLTAIDNCDAAASVGFEEAIAGACPDPTVITRTWTAEDACGNTEIHVQTITIAPDTEAPVLSAMPLDIDLTCTDDIPLADAITATDNCTTPINVVLVETDDMGVCPDPRIITRTWTATDDCTNEVVHVQTITIAPDTEAPVFVEALPVDEALTCADAIPAAAVLTAMDNCTTPVTVIFTEIDDALVCPDVRTITRTWTAADDCTDQVVHIQVITIAPDVTPPAFVEALPADEALTCADMIPVAAVLTATDDCANPVNVVFNEVDDALVCPDTRTITRTWTATDDCTNEVEHIQVITIAPDVTPPAFVEALPADEALTCADAIPAVAVLTATDDCTTLMNVVFNEIDDALVCPDARTITRTWTATDDCMNAIEHVQVITIAPDVTPPAFVEALPADEALTCADAIPAADVLTAADNCTNPVTVIFTEVDDALACPDARTITRTWTATDDCMNEVEHIQVITIAPDTEAPTFVEALPADIALTCADVIPVADVLTATDDCSVIIVVFDEVDNAAVCPDVRGITRTWTATDDCGNEVVHVQNITIAPDTEAPVLSEMPVDVTLGCGDPTPDIPAITAADNCSAVEVVFAETEMGDCPLDRVIERTWTATDDCGNTVAYTQTITIAPDTEMPVLSAMPADITLGCGDLIPDPEMITATDNCTDPVEVIITEIAMGDCPVDRVIERTWTATDACGNEATHTQIITVAPDTEMPVLSAMPIDITLACSDAIPPADVITATDNCTTPIVVVLDEVDDAGVCPASRIITRTWTATDACGNEATHTQIITVEPDTEAPVLSEMPADLVLTCVDAIPDAAPVTATDDCAVIIDFVFNDDDDDLLCPDDRTITRTWTATDECGNVTEHTQTITILPDTDAPVLSALPVDITLTCADAIPPAEMLTATDICDTDVIVVVNEVSDNGVCPAATIITRTYSATDDCGNEAVHVQTITIEPDTELPVFSALPADITLACADAIPAADVLTATDNCTDPINVVFNEVSDNGVCPAATIITRTWTATDACGNEAMHTQIITIEPDTELPVFSAMPMDMVLTCVDDIPLPEAVTATDNCTTSINVVFNENDNNEVCPDTRIIIRTWVATDACGNEAMHTQTITFEPDTEGPVLSTTPASVDLVCGDAIPPVETITATDNCTDVVNVVFNENDDNGVCPMARVITRTWTVTDACDNVTEHIQTITIAPDTEAPILSATPPDLQLSCNDAIPPTEVVTAIDDCDAPITVIFVETDDNGGICPADGGRIITRTWTATDACGNIGTHTQTINILDDTPPTILVCPVSEVDLICSYRVPLPDVSLVLATDECGIVAITWEGDDDPVALSCPGNPRVVTRTYRATDECGNFTDCIQTFTYAIDDVPPVVKVPEGVTLTCDESLPTFAESLALVDYADENDCTLQADLVVDIADDFPMPTSFCESDPRVITRTYTVTDFCGNTTVRTQTFTYEADLTPPTITACPDAAPIILQCGDPLPPVDISIITATDNCTADDDILIIAQDDINPATTISCDGSPITVIRTYTAIDNCGNEATCQQTFTYAPDTEAPTITVCPLDVVDLQCGDAIPEIDTRLVIAEDNCIPMESIMIEGADDIDPATFSFCAADANGMDADGNPAFVVTRTYTAMDKCGNANTCTQLFIFDVDTEGPAFTCPAGELNLAPGTLLPPVDIVAIAASATDNCSGEVTVTHDDPPLPVDYCRGSNLTVVRTITATDACGNISTCEQTFTYAEEDNPPTIVCPTEITVCADEGVCEAVVNWPDPMPMDDCPGLQVITTHNSGDTFPIGNTAVSYTLIDGSGNVTTCKFVVIVEDCEAPIIDCPASPITVSNNAGQCTAVVVINPPASASDNCVNVNVTNDIPSANVFPVGTTTVTYTATDDAGNTATCAIDVIVNDNELPTVTCPTDIMMSAPMGQCDATVTWVEPTPADNCPGVTIVGSHASGDVFPVGTTTVIYTVTDAAGNVATCDFNITVTDDEAPVFNCINGVSNTVYTTTNPGVCGTVPTWDAPTATDNCGVTISTSFAPGTIFLPGATPVTYTATDPSGNTATCKFVVIVTDEELPTIECPADITGISAEDGLCSAIVNWATPVFADNCPGASITSTHSSGDAFPVGTTTVTYTVTDFYGNEATCAFDITVTDDEDPEIFCPGDILITTSPGQCEAVLTWIQPIPTDNCDTDITTTVTHKPGTSFPIGTTTVLYTATDDAGNQATCSFDVTVVDDEAPEMTCPADVTVSADEGTCEAIITWATPVVSDNCPGGVTVVSTHNSGDTFSVGTTTVTYTATDANGRITQCSFIVTVNDDEAPPLTCPADITVSTESGTCGAVVTWTAPEPVMGDCLGVGITVTSNFNPGDTFPLGTTSVIYSAVDGAGNTALCSFNVTVVDNEPPSVLECPTNIEMFTIPGMCNAIVEWTPPVPEPMDNCPGVVIIGSTHDSGDSFPLGTTMVTYTIQDASGNITTCSFTVTIIDDEVPTIVCPADITETNDIGECGAIVSWTAPIPQDNCPGATIITSSHNPGDFFPVGTTKVVYTMEDATGAVAQCSFNITVEDNNPVLLQCPADVVADTDGGQCTATVFWDAPLYHDNCDETNLSSNHEPGDVFPLGCTTVEYYVTQIIDGQLQIITQCEFEVCVEDNEAPSFDCPTDILVSTDPGTCTAFVNWAIPVPSDNCPGAVISGSSHSPGQAFPIGSTTVTYTIDDANGNSELCIFNITVEDNSILAITCPDDINVATANCETAVNWAVPSATGNCSGALTTTSTHNSGDIFSIGCTTVTYTVSDINNNTVSCDFDVCVEDTAGPTLTCPADITVSASSEDNVCGADVIVPVPLFGAAYNDCTGATIINSMNGTSDASAFYPVGVTDVIWTVTDDDGNVTTCEQSITVIDNTILIVDCPDDITVTTIPGSCSAIVAWNEPDASDNCTEVNSIISSHNSGEAFPVGCTTVTYTVLGGGGAATCNFDVCVEECAAGFNDITESVEPLISDQDVFVGGTDQQSFAANGVYTFTDPASPASAILSNIDLDLFFRVQGASCESDIEVQLTDPSGAIVYTGAPFTTCNGSGTHPAGDLYNTTISIPSATTTGGATNWILQFRDTNDQNTGGVEYSVRFGRINYDYTISVPIPGGCADPVIVNCPADISTSATNSCGANLTIPAPVFGVDFTDCTNATITNSYTGTSSGSGFYPVGTTMVTWTVTDAGGNTVSCQQSISIVDDVNPSITCPPNVTVTTSSGNCDGSVNWAEPNTNDNCGVASVTSTHSSGDVFPTGTTTVTYTVTDNSGNTATCSFDVTVQDLAELSMVCPSDITAVTQPGQCAAAVTWSVPTVISPCAAASITSSSHAPGMEFGLGCTTVSYTATDDLGNTTGCSFEVCVDECTGGGAPTTTTTTTEDITLIDDGDLFVGFNDSESFSSNTTYTFNDPGTPANAVISNVTLQLFFRVEYASCESDIEIRVTDPAGNVVYTGPMFTTCNGSGTNPYPGQLYVETITIPDGVAMTTGTLTNWVVEFRDTDDQNPGVNEYSVRFGRLIYDATISTQSSGGTGCGLPLIANCPADVTTSATANCAATVNIPVPEFGVDFLDCAGATIANSYTGTADASGTYPLGTTTVTWTVTDTDGNVVTCEQSVTVTDEVAPTLTCPTNVSVNTAPGQCDATATWAEPTLTDNCDASITSRSHNSGDTFPIGCTTVTYTAMDDAGNMAECSFEVCVDECSGGATSGTSTTETITLISDEDLFVGAADAQSFASNGTYTFTDPATAANAVISNATLQLFFRVENASCESDIEIQLNDPAGNVVYTGALFTTCNGSGTNPYPGQLYNITIPISGGNTTGSTADWVLEFRDTNDQNAAAVEYSVRFGRLIYDATVTTPGGEGCGLPAIVNCPADITVNANANCEANITIPIPVYGVDYLDCVGATMTNDYTGTSNASAIYAAGTTEITWTVIDTDGNIVTCTQNITVLENGCNNNTGEFASCPNDLSVTTTPGNCGAVATWTIPTVTGGTLSSTHNPGEEFPVGCTTVTYTIAGTTATCSFDVCVNECTSTNGESATETITLIDDSDVFIGFNDMESFSTNTTYTFNDPGTPANAVITNATLQLFFRVEYASCESDIEVRLTDPAGNVVYTGTPFSTCNGSGTNPYPGQLYNTTIAIPDGTAMTTGSLNDWTVEFRDTNDQNPGVNEYTARFGRLIYDATVTTPGTGGCADPVIVNCPADITADAAAGECEAAVTVPVPQFGTDFTDCTSATIANDYTGTANASATYPAGITTIVWTVTDAQGNTATCEQNITVNPGFVAADAVALVSDSDLFVGDADTESFADNGTYLFTDPATPANATLSNINLLLYFRVENASCESDIEIQVTDPAGNVVYLGAPFTSCNGSGTNPYPGQLYNTIISIPSASTTGSLANWIVQFRDTNDQNAGAVEYSVRYGRFNYDIGGALDCDDMLINQGTTPSVTSSMVEESELGHDIKLYPVPTMGRLTLEYTANEDEQIQVEILNVNGQAVRNIEQQVFKGLNTIDLEVYELPGGMYFVKTIDKLGTTKVKPFTKLAP